MFLLLQYCANILIPASEKGLSYLLKVFLAFL